MPWKSNTLGPILKNNSGKWKNELSNIEIIMTELICREAFLADEYCESKYSIKYHLINRSIMVLLSKIIRFIGDIYIQIHIAYQSKKHSENE